LGHRTDGRVDLAVDRLGLGSQGAQRPDTLTGEEAEVAGRGDGHLGGELAGLVEQAHEAGGDRLTLAGHLALDHGLLGDVDAVERQATLNCAAHQADALSYVPGSSPRTIGTPMREPYSVQEPS